MSFPSVSGILERLTVAREATDVDGIDDGVYVNKDTRPLPPARRTYGPWSFVGLWMVTGSFNIGGYNTGSSILSLGLNVWQAMLVVIIGHSLVAVVCICTGMPGAEWHIGFPILQRSTWGIRGSIFPLCIRILLSFVWCSTQLWWGGKCVRTLLGAIWPSFYNLNKPLAGGTMEVSDFVGFILFAVICAPLIWFPPERYHRFFIVASVFIVACVFSMLGWAVATANGAGALVNNTSAVVGVAQARGSDLGWAFMYGISSMLGGICVHLDYTRFAKRPRDQLLSQAILVPMGTIVNSLIGIVVTSCAATLYPEEGLLWQPYDLLEVVQRYANNSSRTRAAIAFASIAFISAQIGIAVVENALSGGIDLAGLFPRFFTLRRGGYLTLLLAFVFQPWQTLNGASNFLSVIGSFSTFLAPMIAIMVADYFVVRKRKLSLVNLFTNSEDSIYWFNRGISWRTVACWFLGMIFLMPGFAANVRKEDLGGWSRLYSIGFLLGFAITFCLYVGSHLVWPIQHATDYDAEDVFGTFGEPSALSYHDSQITSDADEEKAYGKSPNVMGV